MNEILLVIGAILFFIGFFVGQSAGRKKGRAEGHARGKEEGYHVGVEVGQGAALPMEHLPVGTYTVVNTTEAKTNPAVIFAAIRVPKEEPLYDERGEIITVVLPKGSEPLPALPFQLSKKPDGTVTYSRLQRGSAIF